MPQIGQDELYLKVLEMYKQGYSCKDISSTCNLPVLYIRNFLKQHGFNTRIYRKVSVCNKDKVILLIRAGYPYNQIERLLHISTHLIREIVSSNGLTGFAPKYHHAIDFKVKKPDASEPTLNLLRELYFSGMYGLAKCFSVANASDDLFLWFVYHLNEEDKVLHEKQVKQHILSEYQKDIPVTAIAKAMDISPSIVKKILFRAV